MNAHKNKTHTVWLSGAGISVSAGIPDFRTKGTGLYSRLEKYELYVFLNTHSHSHFFNKFDIHTSYMHKYSSPLSLVSHLLLHILTQAIIYNYLTLEPQGGVEQRHGGFRQRHLHRITEFAKVGIQV